MSDEKIELENVDLNADANLSEATAAAETIKAKPSRAAKIAEIVANVSKLSDEDLNGFIESIKAPKNPIADGTAARNAASVAMKTVTKEELEGLFGDELSEDFRVQTTVLFESALNARVGVEVAAISEELEAKYTALEAALEEAHVATLEQEVSDLTTGLYESIDSYITYAAQNWLAENEVAVTKSLKSELAEDFMGKMKDLFLEHNLQIDDESEDILAEMTEARTELEAKVNELTEEVIALKLDKDVTARAEAITESTAGLAMTQIDRIRSLAENIDADSFEEFEAKLVIIKESVAGVSAPATGILVEEAPSVTVEELNEESAPAKPTVDPRMQAYLDAAAKR